MRNDGFKREFFVNRQGKDFVLYQGLLDCAHRSGLADMDVDVLQYPNKENNFTAVCKAHAVFHEIPDKDGHEGARYEFGEVGDANPDNVGRMIAPHILRMAATRAKARALRDALNIGVTALEELGDDHDDERADPALASRGFATGGREATMTVRQAEQILTLTGVLNLNVAGTREKLAKEPPTAAAANDIIKSLTARVDQLAAREAPKLDNPHHTPTMQDKAPVGKAVFGVTPPPPDETPEDRDIPL